MSRVLPLQSDSSDSQEIPRGVRGAWQGGPCHQCGDDMPANLVHCQTCRALLNSELTEDSVEIPKFVPLREVKPTQVIPAKGHYVPCPGCQEELRINQKISRGSGACRFCSHSFSYDQSTEVTAVYADCPHCTEELRAIQQVHRAKCCLPVLFRTVDAHGVNPAELRDHIPVAAIGFALQLAQEANVVSHRIAECRRLRKCFIQNRSIPRPNANPETSSGS